MYRCGGRCAMNIALVEDDIVEADIIINYIKRYCREKEVKLDITHFKTAEDFLRAYKQSYFSIVFMDIELPGIGGLDAARSLRQKDDCITIIFVTKMAQYARNGYEVAALDFIVKPVTYADFSLKLKKAVNVARSKEVKSVLVPVNSGFYRVSTDKLIYVEIMGHRIKYQLTDMEIEARGTLSEAEKKLEGCGFLKCNSCYLVNSRYVNKVDGNEVDVGGYKLKISHPKRRAFLEAFMNILTGGGDVK